MTLSDLIPSGIWDPQGGRCSTPRGGLREGHPTTTTKTECPPPLRSVLTSGNNARSDPPIMEVYEDTSHRLANPPGFKIHRGEVLTSQGWPKGRVSNNNWVSLPPGQYGLQVIMPVVTSPFWRFMRTSPSDSRPTGIWDPQGGGAPSQGWPGGGGSVSAAGASVSKSCMPTRYWVINHPRYNLNLH